MEFRIDCDKGCTEAEFAALEMKKYNDAMDMDILVRKKPFRDEKQSGFVNDVDSDDADQDTARRLHSEFLGGGGESDCEENDDTEGDLTIKRQAIKKCSLDECKAITLDSSFKDIKKLIKEDPRYSR